MRTSASPAGRSGGRVPEGHEKLGAHGARPDHVEVAGSVVPVLPLEDVAADGRAGLGIKVEARDLPPALPEGAAHGPRAREELEQPRFL